MNHLDAAEVERIRNNLTEYNRRKQAREAYRNAAFYPEWAGVFQVNVGTLLDIIDRSAPDADHSSDGGFRYPVNHTPDRRPRPTGTGWPVKA